MNITKKFGWATGIAAILTIGAVALPPGAPAHAADTCGRWWPDGGKTIQSYNPGTATYTATTYFTFSQANINAFHCEGQKYMEVDQLVQYAPPQGGNKTGSTNLPGYTYIDTDFQDTTRTLTYGTDAAQSLVANYQYYVTVNLKNVGYDIMYTQIGLTFQRSHKVGPSTNPKESAFWAVCKAHGGSDPVWCVAPSPNGSQPMQSELGPPMYVELHAGYTSTNSMTWGSYRQRQFTPTATMVPGDKIFSPNNLNYLFMQSDGNLVEYIPGGRVVWASNTAGNPGAVFIAQGDGNYVIVAPGNRPIWATGTKSGGTTLKIQDDRNLVVYAPVNKAIWSNNVAGQP